jgi:hypothetical protein
MNIVDITVSNTVGIVSISYDDGAEYFPSVYDKSSFSFDVTFNAFNSNDSTPPELTPTPISNVSITYTPATIPGLTIVVANNDPTSYVMRFSGTISGLFNESYDFVILQNSDIANNQANQISTANYTYGNVPNGSVGGIYNWNIPTTRTALVTYDMKVSDSVSNVHVIKTQTIFWNLNTSVAAFQNLVSSGGVI